jgi:predicted transcriptional regulator
MTGASNEFGEEPVVFDDDDEAEVRRVMADMDGGKFVSHEAVARWLKSWGTDNELPPPECGD